MMGWSRFLISVATEKLPSGVPSPRAPRRRTPRVQDLQEEIGDVLMVEGELQAQQAAGVRRSRIQPARSVNQSPAVQQEMPSPTGLTEDYIGVVELQQVPFEGAGLEPPPRNVQVAVPFHEEILDELDMMQPANQGGREAPFVAVDAAGNIPAADVQPAPAAIAQVPRTMHMYIPFLYTIFN